MRIETVPIDQLNPAPYNPRVELKPGDPAYEKIKRSLDEFGLVEPLVWNRLTGNIVGGHQRYNVLLARGDKEVQVSVVELSPEREKLLNVALNRLTGEWDDAKLAALLDELTKLPDVDATLTGFDLPDIADLLAATSASAEREESFDVEAALDDARSRPAVTRPGDLIKLGRHFLLCGDSASATAVKLVTDGAEVHLLFTDPPYNVDYDAAARPGAKSASKQGGSRKPAPAHGSPKLANDALDQVAYERWLESVLRHAVGALAIGSAVYIWNGHRQFGPMHTILPSIGVHVSCVITWAKERFAIGRGDYKQQTEFCLYGWRAAKGRRRHRWYGGNDQSTLWQVARDPLKEYVHPTQKPLELAERAIRNSTRAGETVLDPFLGSGTSIIAAERTGRRCVGIELDPYFCDVIVRRYLSFLGDAGVDEDLRHRYAVDVKTEVAA